MRVIQAAAEVITSKEISDTIFQASLAVIVMCIAMIYLTARKKRDAARAAAEAAEQAKQAAIAKKVAAKKSAVKKPAAKKK